MRLSLRLVLIATAVLVPAAALAAPISLASNTASTSYNGYSQTSNTPSTLPSASVYNIGNGDGIWYPALAGSTYISFEPNTNPNGAAAQPGNHAPNGYYTYTSTFSLSDLADASGSITVLADDTVDVYLNSTQIVMAANGPYPLCAVSQPNCTSPLTASLSGFVNGTNTLTFVVHQANDYATGLDYTGSVLTPEPNSLFLLGTGLVGGAGAVLRRFRRS